MIVKTWLTDKGTGERVAWHASDEEAAVGRHVDAGVVVDFALSNDHVGMRIVDFGYESKAEVPRLNAVRQRQVGVHRHLERVLD